MDVMRGCGDENKRESYAAPHEKALSTLGPLLLIRSLVWTKQWKGTNKYRREKNYNENLIFLSYDFHFFSLLYSLPFPFTVGTAYEENDRKGLFLTREKERGVAWKG